MFLCFRAVVLIASLILLPSCQIQIANYAAVTQIANHVVINEFELNPPGDDKGREWVELYNPTRSKVDLSRWRLQTSAGKMPTTIAIPSGICLDYGGSYVVTYPELWLDNLNEMIILLNADGDEVDRTPVESDTDGNNYSWQRVPDGTENWVFQPSTPEAKLCELWPPPWLSQILTAVAASVIFAVIVWLINKIRPGILEVMRETFFGRRHQKHAVPTQSLMALTFWAQRHPYA